jgi:hypothetical protein
MTLDLDDLPPRIARQLAELADGEDLVLVRNGALVARLQRAHEPAPVEADEPALSQEEVLEQFNAMIHDEF